MRRGNWTDKPCYYVSCVDGPRKALLAGPFAHQRQAAACVDRVRAIGEQLDPRAVGYAFGTCKAATGHYEGGLNKQLDFDQIPHRPRQYVRRPDRYGF